MTESAIIEFIKQKAREAGVGVHFESFQARVPYTTAVSGTLSFGNINEYYYLVWDRKGVCTMQNPASLPASTPQLSISSGTAFQQIQDTRLVNTTNIEHNGTVTINLTLVPPGLPNNQFHIVNFIKAVYGAGYLPGPEDVNVVNTVTTTSSGGGCGCTC